MNSSVPNDRDDYRSLLEELEVKKQELHTAHKSMEILKRNVQHLEDENAEIRHELDESVRKLRGKKNEEQVKFDEVYKQKIADLEQCLEVVQASERAAKEENRRLEQKLKHVLATATSCAPLPSGQDEEIIHELHNKLTQLEEEKASLKERLVDAALEHQRLANDLSSLQQELQEKEEEVNCLESQFTSQCSINEHLRDENAELRAKLETDEIQVGTNKKGNSLFAEVDDRRVQAETKIVKLESVFKKLEEQLTKEQKENKRLKQQVLLLRQTSTANYSEDSVKRLQADLRESKRQIIQLTESLQKKEEAAPYNPSNGCYNVSNGSLLPSMNNMTDSDKNYIKYLQDIIQEKEKQLKLKSEEAQQSDLHRRRTDSHLTETKIECMALTRELNKLKSMNAHLNISYQELQRKYEPEPTLPTVQEKMKIVLDEPKITILSAQTNALIQKDGEGSVKCSSEGEDKENSSVLQTGNKKSLLPETKDKPQSSSVSSVRQRVLGQNNTTNTEVKCKPVIHQVVEEPAECKQQ